MLPLVLHRDPAAVTKAVPLETPSPSREISRDDEPLHNPSNRVPANVPQKRIIQLQPLLDVIIRQRLIIPRRLPGASHERPTTSRLVADRYHGGDGVVLEPLLSRRQVADLRSRQIAVALRDGRAGNVCRRVMGVKGRGGAFKLGV